LLTDPKIGSSFSMVDYGFLYARDTSDIDADDHVSIMHTWILDDPANKLILRVEMRVGNT